MAKIMLSEWNGWGLNNGEHLDYSKAVVGALRGLDPAKVPVAGPVASLEALNEKYTDFINESRKYVDTADIAKADARRDALFYAIWGAVERLATLDGDGENSLGRRARVAQAVLTAYKGVPKHSLPKETEELRGLAHDLQKTPAAVEAITALGMLQWLNALFAANDEVDTLYTHRMGERGERASEAGGDTTDSIRKEAANLISEIIATVNAAQRLLPSEELDHAVAALAGVIEQYKLVAAGHGGKKETPPEPESASEAGK